MSRTYGLRPRPTNGLISPLSVEANSFGRHLSSPATGVSPWSDAADFILCYPITLDAPTTCYKGWWFNGSAAGGNSDVAIYDENFNYIQSTGSVAGTGSTAPQAAALGATITLPPGRYYLGMSHNATTTNQLTRFSLATIGTAVLMGFGCFKSNATDTPPIATTAITPADLTNVAFPLFGLVTRSVFDL